MFPLLPLLKKAHYPVLFLPIFYFLSLSILTFPWAQRQLLYLHNANTRVLQDPNEPSRFGFLQGQVQPFFLNTSDDERLYGWHVLPIELYAKHQEVLQKQPTWPSDYQDPSNVRASPSLNLLLKDPEATIIVNFHGNAGTVAQGWRTDTYRSLTSLQGGKVHLLTVDYRGYGYSTGSPDEEGIITDGVSFVKWLTHDLGISADRLILVGQSLGTAVSVAVAERLAVQEDIAIRNIVLVSAFADVPSLLRSYRIAGFIPVLAPLNGYPALQNVFLGQVRETWYSTKKIASLVRKTEALNLFIVHGKNDPDIPWTQSETLFHAAANATSEKGLTIEEIKAAKDHRVSENGGFVNSWTTRKSGGGKIFIRHEVFPYGGKL